MVEIIPVQKIIAIPKRSSNMPYYEDKTDDFDTTGIVVDDDSYDTGTFLDRDYDVRLDKAISILLENLGANDVKYTILSTTEDYDVMNDDLEDNDFTEVEKAEATITAGASATGSVEVTGGPSVKADGTLTCVSAKANTFADGDIVCASVQAGDTVTFNGLLYTAVNGAKANDTEFDMSGTNDQCATDLADSIDDDTRSGTSGDQSATATTDTVTGVTDVAGTAGNAITLISSNGTRLAVTGSGFLTGGVNADTVTVNGLVYTAVAGAKANDTQFSIDTSDNATATDLADSIDDDVRTPVTVPTIDVTAAAGTNVVTVSAPLNDGAAGNAIDISATGGTITADNANLTSGLTSTMNSILVGTVPITNGVAIPWRTSDTLTADDIRDAINAHTSNPNYSATENGAGVVTITKIASGDSTLTVVSATTIMTKTDGNMSGGSKGVSAVTNIVRTSPQQTAIRIRCKEAASGSPGRLRGDVKFL